MLPRTVRGSALGVGALLLTVVSSTCSKPRSAWPGGTPEVDTIKVREGVVTITPAVSNKTKVTKSGLVFPAEMASEVMANWPAGKVVVGPPATDMAARATNPFGFLRKVKGTRIEGDTVVVETEPATLDEAVVGDFVRDLDLESMTTVELPENTDLSAYDVPVELGKKRGLEFPTGLDADGGTMRDRTMQPLTDPSATTLSLYSGLVGKKEQALDVRPGVFEVPSTPLTLLNFTEPIRIPTAPGASLDVSAVVRVTPTARFQPRLHMDYSANVVPPRLNWAEFSVGGDLTVGSAFDISVSALRGSNTTVQQEVLLLNALRINKLLEKEVQVPIGRPIIKSFTLGPVPMVSTTSAFLQCTATFEGAVQVRGSLQQTISATVGLRYSRNDGWSPIRSIPLRAPTVNGELLGGQAGIELDCGVILRTDVRAAGVAGPYAQVRADVVGTAKVKEECPMPDNAPKNHAADVKVDLGVKAYAALQVGVDSIDFLSLITLEYGPYDIWRKNWNEGAPMTTPNPNFIPGCVGLYCPAATITEPEFVDIRTWSSTRTGAGRGQPDAGLWCRVQCEDQTKNGSEADVDCGGSNCAKCMGGQTCAANGDCLSNVCGGNGRCAASLCEDGVKGQQETDVDCGGPTCRPCVLNAVCAADRDCGTGFCSNDGVMPRTCTTNLCRDGRVSGAEPAIDCGASEGCARLCATGQPCNTAADCVGSACNVNTKLCVATTCFDGALNGDEADVDCGGSCAAKCAIGNTCDYSTRQNVDCQSGVCATAASTLSPGRCVASTCNDNRADVDETDIDCGGATCSARCPVGGGCAVSTDCGPGNVCNRRTNRCAPPGCDDAILNGQESSIDCGGPTCVKCGLAKTCNTNVDCVSGSCFQGRCVSGPCENGVKDTTEADVDCGGTCSGRACATGKTCTAASDCASNLCVGGVCSADACLDRVRNGTETGVDCGGPTCTARCAAGAACAVNADCTSNVCNTTLRVCAASTCGDGLLTSGSETDVDCGSTCGASNPAARCAVNKNCAASSDCASGVCNLTTLRCVPDQCFDGVRNGSETDVDCGGSCDPKCAAARLCAVNADCQSGSCNAMGRCASDQCSDGRLNGNETGVDCGGSCATKCGVGQGCTSGADCVHPQMLVGQPGYCSVTSFVCTASSCGDGVQDGDETGLDCGGSCTTKCPLGPGCNVNADCVSGICNATTHLCVASQCQDGVRNGTETDIDCGGTCGGSCQVGQGCTEDFHCLSGYCGAASLCIPPIPKSCLAVYNRNGPGDRTDNTFLIDPDGPRTQSSGIDTGHNSPFLTFCKNAPESVSLAGVAPGGWTPVMYLNSRTSWFSGAGPNFENTSVVFTPPPDESCSFSNQACSSAPGTTCRANTGGPCLAGSARCSCTAPGRTWTLPNAPGLPAHPINYSATTYGGGVNSFQMHLNHQNFNRTATSTTNPSIFRLIAYRAGVVAFDSQPFYAQPPVNDLYGWQMGKFSTRNTNSNYSPNAPWLWCRTGDYTGQMNATEPIAYFCDGPNSAVCWPSYQDTLPRSNLTACNGFVRSFHLNITLDSTSNQSVGGGNGFYFPGATWFTAQVLPNPSNNQSNTPSHSGVWWGSFGVISGGVSQPFVPGWLPPYPTTGIWMGLCNNIAQTNGREWPCLPYIHRGGVTTGPGAESNRQMILNPNETTVSGSSFSTSTPGYGTMVDGSAGLVFVLWAQF